MSDNKERSSTPWSRLPRMTQQPARFGEARSAAAIEAEKVISPDTFESAKAAAGRALEDAFAKLSAEGGR